MCKSKINSSQKISKVVPVCLSISILSLFPSSFAIADTSLASRENGYLFVQNESSIQSPNKLAPKTRKPSTVMLRSEASSKELVKNGTLISFKLSQGDKKPSSPAPNVEQIKQVAKAQNATIVQYSIIYDDVNIDGKKQTQESELVTWVIKPSGEIVMRRLNLQGKRSQGRFSLLSLIQRSRRKLGVRSMGLEKGITTIEKIPEAKPSQSELKELHQILIQPIADLLPQKPEERVVFIPQGDLFLVAFAALQDTNGKYLIEKHTISTAPSIQVLDLLYQRKVERKGEQSFTPANIKGDELLIVGNPTVPKVLKPGENPIQLSPIPGAEQEAKSIAEIFKTQALAGDAATETAIVQRMPQAKIIHLATHACELNNSNVIALAASNQDDGWLSVEEIEKLNLKADLVVLSAANTALGKITGDGVIGFSRAFFVAGADSVVGTLWEGNDMTMVFLMTEFYNNLSKNTDKAGALRQAMLETMKKYPNPQDWAAFTLVGLL